MNASQPQAKYRKDYLPPAFLIDHIDLRLDIHESYTDVRSTLGVRRNPDSRETGPLRLDGEQMQLLSLDKDGEPLPRDNYHVDDKHLQIDGIDTSAQIDLVNRIRPADNTSLQGLYRSGNIFCTQCEAEGFRHITYFLDRPDVMTTYTTTIEAERDRYPVLLCNGNPEAKGETGDGRHWVRWEDPHPKPSYLFALVAGDLSCAEEVFTTGSGRRVDLRLYVEPGNEGRCAHALACLKAAMAWDERVYGLEYDLDVYMIVAVSAFNMGAMENKGLNLFNDKFILADDAIATDQDFTNIEDVVAHEYFHNWTGNRVTLRDWFQLSLKESLTVFREQSFSADQGMAAVKRIAGVRGLRTIQFPEDGGPTAHPVRPESYIEMNNFYTMTIYQKGAEVIRMLHTLLGDDGFRSGVRAYLARHDGQAVTIEDFVSALEDDSARDLQQFRLWYSQAGTPELTVTDDYDEHGQTYTLKVEQRCPPTPGQPDKAPMHIPLRMGLLDSNGNQLALAASESHDSPGPPERVLSVRESVQTFRFPGVRARPVPSLLRGFSAPVRLHYSYSAEQRRLLIAHDSDPFSRWDAAQQLLLDDIRRRIENDASAPDSSLMDTFATLADRGDAAPDLLAQMLTLPDERYIGEQFEVMNVDAIAAARAQLRAQMGQTLETSLLTRFDATQPLQAYRYDGQEAGRRQLHRVCLGYLCASGKEDHLSRAEQLFDHADNMTDTIAALAAINDSDSVRRQHLFERFEAAWAEAPLVLDKWFSLQAVSRRSATLEQVRTLLEHPRFDLRNPNRVRALLGAFTMNLQQFHRADGQGYRFTADHVLILDPLNAQVASRLAKPLLRWRRVDRQRGETMKAELQRIIEQPGLSADVFEIVSKSLEFA